MEGGRRMEGNSIYMALEHKHEDGRCKDPGRVGYQSLVLSQEDGDASVDLADGKGDQHRGSVCKLPSIFNGNGEL